MTDRMEIEDREIRAKIHYAELRKLLYLDRWQGFGGDPRRFPFQSYEPRLALPYRQEIEIERLIAPYFGRYGFLVFYAQGNRRYRTHMESKPLLDAIQGQIYGWGWPVRGMFVNAFGGPRWV